MVLLIILVQRLAMLLLSLKPSTHLMMEQMIHHKLLIATAKQTEMTTGLIEAESSQGGFLHLELPEVNTDSDSWAKSPPMDKTPPAGMMAHRSWQMRVLAKAWLLKDHHLNQVNTKLGKQISLSKAKEIQL